MVNAGHIDLLENPMRKFALIALAGLAILGSLPAGAQSRDRLYIEIKPRSWLDAGKAGVRVGEYQNYVYDMHGPVGPTSGIAGRYNVNLPDRFFGGRPFSVDIPAPDFLRR
jgi:hypothetical protein